MSGKTRQLRKDEERNCRFCAYPFQGPRKIQTLCREVEIFRKWSIIQPQLAQRNVTAPASGYDPHDTRQSENDDRLAVIALSFRGRQDLDLRGPAQRAIVRRWQRRELTVHSDLRFIAVEEILPVAEVDNPAVAFNDAPEPPATAGRDMANEPAATLCFTNGELLQK